MSSSIHYCFIAKDADMVVFEAMVAKELNQQSQAQRAAFRKEIRDRLHELDLAGSDGAAGDSEAAGFIMRNATANGSTPADGTA
jgi:Synaptobrevin